MPSATRATRSTPASASRATGVARVEPERVARGPPAGPAPAATGGGVPGAVGGTPLSAGGIGDLAPVEDHDGERQAERDRREIGDDLEPGNRTGPEQRVQVEGRRAEALQLLAGAR